MSLGSLHLSAPKPSGHVVSKEITLLLPAELGSVVSMGRVKGMRLRVAPLTLFPRPGSGRQGPGMDFKGKVLRPNGNMNW